MIFNKEALIAYARNIASKEKLSLVIKEDLLSPMTDGKTIYMPPFNSLWEKGSDEETWWWYAFIHEIRHNVHSTDFDVMKANNIDMRSTWGFVHNLNLDHNIEYCGIGRYTGMDKALKAGRLIHYKQTEEKSAHIKNKNPMMDAIWKFDMLVRRRWNPTIKMPDLTNEDELHYLDILNKFADRWEAKKNSDEVYELTKEIADALGIGKEPPQDKEQQEKKKQKSSSEEKGEGKDSGSDGEEGDENGDEEGAEGSGGVVDYYDLLNHEHTPQGTKGNEGLKIDYSKWQHYEGYTPGPLKTIKPDLTTPINSSFVQAIREMSDGDNLARDIRKYIQTTTQKKITSNHRRGRLNTRQLWKTAVYADNSDTIKKLHIQRTAKKELDTSVMILVDNSGSMGRDKYKHATKACSLLLDVFNTLHIPTAIQSFTDNCYSECAINFIHKEFNERLSVDDLIKSFGVSNTNKQSNADGMSIEYAAGNLINTRNKRKILIVLSDGMPATRVGNGDIFGYTKKIVEEIEKSEIDIFGIGIQSYAVQDIYANNRVINDAKDIEKVLLSLLKEEVLI